MHDSTIGLRVVALVSVVCSVALGQADGADLASSFVTGASSCPTPSEVSRETLRLTPADHRQLYSSHVRIQIEDFGESYRVRVLDPALRVQKTYMDPSRDCARRATFAAILVVLTLMPPQVALDPPDVDGSLPSAALERTEQSTSVPESRLTAESSPVQPHPPDNASQQPSSTKTGSRTDLEGIESDTSVAAANAQKQLSLAHADRLVRIAVGLGLRWAPPALGGLTTTNVGATLECSVGRAPFAGFMALDIYPSSRFQLLGISGQVQRLPAAIGLAWRGVGEDLEVSGELGVVAAFERVRANVLHAQADSAVEIGARFGGSIAYGRSVLSPFLRVRLDAFPSPRDLVVLPRGSIGTTPAIELLSSIGGRLGL